MTSVASLANPELNDVEKMERVLKHTVEMLVERGWVNRDKEKRTIESVNKQFNEGKEEIKIQCDRGRKMVYLFIAYDSSKTKKRHIVDLVSKGSDQVIVISNETKVEKDVRNILNVEFFLRRELMRNIVRHILQPAFRVLSDEEKRLFLEETGLKLINLPHIILGNPVPKYFNMKLDDVIEIIRSSEITIFEPPFHRRCVVHPDLP